jgi:quercetin dioxygenase-like cupin family protein
MIVIPGNKITTAKGSEDKFSGEVWVSTLTSSAKSTDMSAYLVLFTPGARTFWHAHPGEQLLHVLSGEGFVCEAGKEIHIIHPGDTILIGRGEKHWHGAVNHNFMSHLAITTGGPATWMDPVEDSEYFSHAET